MGSSDDDGIPVRCLPSVNRVSPYADTALDPGLNEDSAAVEEYNIDQRDLRQIYLSPHAYDHAFEEELNLATFNSVNHSTAGMELENRDGRLILTDMTPGAPGHRIRRWKSRIRNAWLV